MAVMRRTRARFPVDNLIPERLNSLKYFTYVERFYNLPGINADLASATEATREPVNRDLEILGTNGTSALATFTAGGGMTMTTATGNADQMICLAHLDTKQSALAQANWNSAKSPLFAANIVSGAAIDLCTIWAGWKLTNTPTTATDNDQAFFRFQATTNASWQACTSIAGVDTETDTGVDVAASTLYRLIVDVDASRIPRYYINDELVATGGALTSLTTLEFYIGVELTSGGVARAITVRNFMVSQLLG